MKLLLIEDDRHFASVFSDTMSGESVQITLVRSRDSALQALRSNDFDLILCDLRIPTSDDVLDDAVEHGTLVLREVLDQHSGTPVVIFSAFGTTDLLEEVLEDAKQEDIFGTNEGQAMIGHVPKTKVAKCVKRVLAHNQQMQELARIEIATGMEQLNLAESQKRVLRIHCRRNDGVLAKVSEIGGGLTESRTLRVQVEDAAGATTSRVVAKLGPLSRIIDERRRYEQFVPGKLTNVGAFIALAGEVRAGAGNAGGLFYQLAEGFDKSLFDLLREDQRQAAGVVDRLIAFEGSWQEHAPRGLVPVGDVRRLIANDLSVDDISRVLGVWVEPAERSEVYIARCPQHADLHGLNVLVKESDQPVLIDFGSVMEANAALDPVSLELSILFHPAMSGLTGDWPQLEQADCWSNPDLYLENCPVPDFVGACRSWAHNVAAGDREVLSSAYAYAIRQLRFPDTKHDLAVRIARGVISDLGVA